MQHDFSLSFEWNWMHKDIQLYCFDFSFSCNTFNQIEAFIQRIKMEEKIYYTIHIEIFKPCLYYNVNYLS